MKATIISIVTDIASASLIALTNLDGGKGRKMFLQAKFKLADGNKMWSQLDLNKCFGWSVEACVFTYTPNACFTETVISCDNNYSGGDEHFGSNFGSRGPCTDGGEVYNVFALNSYNGTHEGILDC
ncbi:hypothetical protein UCDDA912_g04150 [Diaporthe ampelina]|uniref:Cyanovirin-N domain-containing protein n=1 Tax=Diaporthe ampelina TaxID=1214573 RepID=A0A0G2FNG5_9PEZI|nr:hypothetical protein UCDDA912_g04150 [Diaporthe ampelina]